MNHKDKESLKIVLDLGRKFVFARYMETCDTGNPKGATEEESAALDAVAKMVGAKMDGQLKGTLGKDVSMVDVLTRMEKNLKK